MKTLTLPVLLLRAKPVSFMLTLLFATVVSAGDRPVESVNGSSVRPEAITIFADAGGKKMPRLTVRSGTSDNVIVNAIRPPDGGPYRIRLYEFRNPLVSQPHCALTGTATYSDLHRPAYLEVRTEFPDGTASVWRNDAADGPERAFVGSSERRYVRVPFDLKAGCVPTKLTVDLVLPGTGNVEFTMNWLVEAFATPATTAAVTPAVPDLPPGVDVASLPPEIVAGMRSTLVTELSVTLQSRRQYADDLAAATAELGDDNPRVIDLRKALTTIDTRIASLQTRIANTKSPLPPATAPVAAVPSLSWGLVQALAGHLVVIAGAAFILLTVSKGFGRRTAVGFFVAVLVFGVAEVFMAGVVVGRGRPPQAMAVLLGGAAVMLGLGVAGLPRVRRQFAAAEMRKMRAMDVPA